MARLAKNVVFALLVFLANQTFAVESVLKPKAAFNPSSCSVDLLRWVTSKNEKLLGEDAGFQDFVREFEKDTKRHIKDESSLSIDHAPQIDLSLNLEARRKIFEIRNPEQMEATGIPKELWTYFDAQTGAFNYKRKLPIILSSESGRQELKAVRISFLADSKKGDWREKVLSQYAQIMEKIPGFDLWVTVKPSDKEVARMLNNKFPKQIRSRVKLIEIDGLNEKNIWAQDGAKPLTELRSTTLRPSLLTNKHYDNALTQLESAKAVDSVVSPFKFEGGDLIVGEKNVFIGTEEINYNMRRLHLTRDETLKALDSEFGRPVIEIGATNASDFDPMTFQRDFHIDLSMAVVFDYVKGREVVLLESPKLFLKKLGSLAKKEFRTKEEKEFLTKMTTYPDSEASSYGVSSRQNYLDAVEEKLIKSGYEVVRIPGYSEGSGEFYNFANSIFSGRNAIVPETGLRSLDKNYQAVLEKMGYDNIVSAKVVKHSIRCLSETYRKNTMEWVLPKDAFFTE